MSEIPRVELPSLVAQSEHVARLGGGRTQPSDVVERNEQAYRLELSARRQAEEVQGSEAIPAVREHARDDDAAGGERRRRRSGQQPGGEGEGEGDDRPHVDVVA